MNIDEIRTFLRNHGLKVTPQRLVVVEALYSLRNHPTAEDVAVHVHRSQPDIATGTIYHILETLVDKGLLIIVKTEKGVMRYDMILERHHHLYCSDCNQIEDYYNDELNGLLEKYFSENEIPGFTIDDVKLQINGHFQDKTKHRTIKK